MVLDFMSHCDSKTDFEIILATVGAYIDTHNRMHAESSTGPGFMACLLSLAVNGVGPDPKTRNPNTLKFRAVWAWAFGRWRVSGPGARENRATCVRWLT